MGVGIWAHQRDERSEAAPADSALEAAPADLPPADLPLSEIARSAPG